MNILLISYSDYNYDGRTRALISVFSRIGNLQCFIRRGIHSPNMTICDVSYPKFIIKAMGYANKMKRLDILVLDNRKATVPGLLIKKLTSPQYVIQDSRELYLFNEVKTISSKIGCIFEKSMSKKADIVICANQERAKIMKKAYSLPREPITYENLRQLQYESDEMLLEAKKKLDKYIHDDEIKIISSSGCSVERTNDILVRNLPKVSKKCRLFLVGSYTKAEVQTIRSIAEKNKKDEITILGQLNQTELKYLISRSDIGVVNYGQYDTNNKYCASGKLYEFLYEGIPVITTTNPPLCRMCKQHGIGVADDDYADAIIHIYDTMLEYRNNVLSYIKNHSIENNDKEFIRKINELIIHTIKELG